MLPSAPPLQLPFPPPPRRHRCRRRCTRLSGWMLVIFGIILLLFPYFPPTVFPGADAAALPDTITVRTKEKAIIIGDNGRATGTVNIRINHTDLFDMKFPDWSYKFNHTLFAQLLLDKLQSYCVTLPDYPSHMRGEDEEARRRAKNVLRTQLIELAQQEKREHRLETCRKTQGCRDPRFVGLLPHTLPVLLSGIVGAYRAAESFYSHTILRNKIDKLLGLYGQHKEVYYSTVYTTLLLAYEMDMRALFLSRCLDGGCIAGIGEDILRATNATTARSAAHLISATPTGCNTITLEDTGDVVMRIYVDLEFPDPTTMRYGELQSVVDTGSWDPKLQVFSHHFVPPLQMTTTDSNGVSSTFPVRNCKYRRGIAFRVCEEGVSPMETRGLSIDTIHDQINGTVVVLDPLRGAMPLRPGQNPETHQMTSHKLVTANTRQIACATAEGVAADACDDNYLSSMRTCDIMNMTSDCPFRIVNAPVNNTGFAYVRKFSDVTVLYTHDPTQFDVCTDSRRHGQLQSNGRPFPPNCTKLKAHSKITVLGLRHDQYLLIGNTRYNGSYSSLPTIFYHQKIFNRVDPEKGVTVDMARRSMTDELENWMREEIETAPSADASALKRFGTHVFGSLRRTREHRAEEARRHHTRNVMIAVLLALLATLAAVTCLSARLCGARLLISLTRRLFDRMWRKNISINFPPAKDQGVKSAFSLNPFHLPTAASVKALGAVAPQYEVAFASSAADAANAKEECGGSRTRLLVDLGSASGDEEVCEDNDDARRNGNYDDGDDGDSGVGIAKRPKQLRLEQPRRLASSRPSSGVLTERRHPCTWRGGRCREGRLLVVPPENYDLDAEGDDDDYDGGDDSAAHRYIKLV